MDSINSNNQTSGHTDLVIKRQVQVEAISKAIYLVTDLFDKEEPLKMSLRRVVINCVEKEYDKDSFIKLNSLINISRSMQLISEMNADILIDVINNHLISLDIKKEKKDIVLENVLSVENKTETIPEVLTEKIENIILKKDEVKDVIDIVKPAQSITINNNTQNIKTINNISMDIGSRRKRILEIVKTRGAVTINEFIESIQGVSSKTIQRELTSLVLSGTLKKTGERRWSKYSLK